MTKDDELPEPGDLVVCTVQDVKNFGAFVSLDEYGGKEGFIHVAEIATGWVKYIRDHVREGQKVVCRVLSVNAEKGHVDLSLKVVNPHQKREKILQWKAEQKAEKMLSIVAERLGKSVDECYELFGNKLIEHFGSLYRAFEEVVANKKILEKEKFVGEWLKPFIDVATENMVPSFVTISGILELTCPRPDGVVHIKDSLLKLQTGAGQTKVEVQYIGAPRYRLIVTAPNYKQAEAIIKRATDTAISHIKAYGGTATFIRKEGK